MAVTLGTPFLKLIYIYFISGVNLSNTGDIASFVVNFIVGLCKRAKLVDEEKSIIFLWTLEP